MNSPHQLLAGLVKWEVFILMGGLCGLIVVRLLTGRINTRNLLWGRRSDQTLYFSPERVQLLVATIGMAMQYVLTSTHSGNGEMPRLPSGAVSLLGLSNVIYLGGKGWNMLRKRQN